METFYTFENGDIIEMQGTLTSTRHLRKTYTVGDITYTGFRSKRAARLALTDQQSRILCRKARKKLGGLRVKDIKRLKPKQCNSYVDWYKWIIMYDGIPPDTENIEFGCVDEYYEKYLAGTLGNYIRKRHANQLTEPPSKRRRRLYNMICNADEEKLECIEKYLKTVL
jgi:hypothetical protein